MRFHILGVPHTVTNKEYVGCAYTQKVLKFGKMMTNLGHEVIHYGHEDSSLICSEHVTVLTNKEFYDTYGSYDWKTNFFKYDINDEVYRTFFSNAIKEIALRKKQNDFILPFWGLGVKPICDAHPDLICVEPGIGYTGVWAKWKIFESYALYHAYCGIDNALWCKQDWYEVVIPNYFDLEDFEFSSDKKDYFLYLGRIGVHKGTEVAIQLTEKIGAKLIIAGQGNISDMGYTSIPKHVEVVGYADSEKRKELMKNAKALIIASKYVEPFGGVQVESLLSGTPTITVDWGAFVENNLHGITGYRCRTFDQFCWAAKNIHKIKPENCRAWGENFSLEKIGPMYEEYFQTVLDVYTGQGWYEPHRNRKNLNWLYKKYPTTLEDTELYEVIHQEEVINYDLIEEEEKPMANNIADWIKDNYPTCSVLDIGCGPGTYVYSLRDRGINAIGVEIDERIKDKEFLINKSLFDLNENIHLSDISICLEVLEHIEPNLTTAAIEKIYKLTKHTLIWSAAIPGQGGVGHINCRPKEEWEQLLISVGFSRNLEKEKSLFKYVERGPIWTLWFQNNFMYFEK